MKNKKTKRLENFIKRRTEFSGNDFSIINRFWNRGLCNSMFKIVNKKCKKIKNYTMKNQLLNHMSEIDSYDPGRALGW